MKTKSGDRFLCTEMEFIEDERFGAWIKLIDIFETNLWSGGLGMACKKFSTEISVDSVESVTRQ